MSTCAYPSDPFQRGCHWRCRWSVRARHTHAGRARSPGCLADHQSL
ncbi:MAG: hypothetical protein ACFFA6_09420 [Promethearchaeota archaeon]